MNYAREYPRFWLSYLVVSLAMFATNTIVGLLDVLSHKPSPSGLGLLFGALGLIPLVGYIRQRSFKPRWLWGSLFVIAAVSATFMALVAAYLAVTHFSAYPLLVLAGLAVCAPYLFALFQYAFRSPHLWP